MKVLKLTILSVFLLGAFACEPKQGTIEDKEAVKNDSVDVREGVGEGPVGESDHK